MVPADLPPLAVRSRPVADPGDLLARLPDPGGFALVRHGEGVVGWGTAARLPVGRGPGRFAEAGARLARLAAASDVDDPVRVRGSGLVAFLAGTFDPDSSSASTLVVPRVVLGRHDGTAWLTTAAPLPADHEPEAVPPRQQPVGPSRVRELGSGVDEVDWLDRVAEAIARIRAGRLSKVVLARDVRVWADEPFDARALAARLAQRFPTCHTFMAEGLVGASPEQLLDRHGRRVRSRVLAGTVGRHPDAATDAAWGQRLLRSAKDHDEHEQAVASARAALAPRCATLTVDAEPWLLRLANVMHLATDLTGELDGDAPADALALIDALHPTAAVCGTPTDVALATLRELEAMDRARYSGPVGWVDGHGDGEVAIALRCAELEGRTGRLLAGSGIVAGSRPEAELEETRLKLEAMRTAIAG